MKITSARIKRLVGKDVFAEIRSLGKVAERNGKPCYLVGGFVRDVILKVPSLDIDVVCDGTITWIGEIAKSRKVTKITRSQFNTVKIHFARGFAFDIARARKEIYPEPASLPVVKPGALREDAMRRDFTINTLLLDISQTDFGRILDFCGGLTDLTKGLIRVLHEKSFIDDPTRILRAIKFKYRFSFRLDRKTSQLLKQAVNKGFIRKLSPQRIYRELFLILGEATWDKTIRHLRRLGVIAQLGLCSSKANRAIGQLKNVEHQQPFPVQSPELTRLLAISAVATKMEISTFSSRVGLRKGETILLHSVLGERKTILKELSRPTVSNSRIFTLLEGIADEGLLFLFAVGSPRARQRIHHYHARLRGITLLITGNDLKTLGIEEGPQFSKILRKILMDKLDGKTGSKRDELSLAKRLASNR